MLSQSIFIFDHHLISLTDCCFRVDKNYIGRLESKNNLQRRVKISFFKRKIYALEPRYIQLYVLLCIRNFEFNVHHFNRCIFLLVQLAISIPIILILSILINCLSLGKSVVLMSESILIIIMVFFPEFGQKLRKPYLTEIFSMQRLT